MGLTNNDAYGTPSGQSITGTYINLGNNVNVSKRNGNIIVNGNGKVYFNKACFDAGKRFVAILNVEVTQADTVTLGDVYVVLMDKLKVDFPNHTEE